MPSEHFRSIAPFRRNEFFPGALGNSDDRMVPFLKTPFQQEKSVQGEWNLWNQAEIHLVVGENENAAMNQILDHQFNETDPFRYPSASVCAADIAFRFGNRSLESERGLDERYVVIDRL
jgi:hypothetical protein